MARTPRTFSCRGHTEAKAGENIGQRKPRENVTDKAKQTSQHEEISEVWFCQLDLAPFDGLIWPHPNLSY